MYAQSLFACVLLTWATHITTAKARSEHESSAQSTNLIRREGYGSSLEVLADGQFQGVATNSSGEAKLKLGEVCTAGGQCASGACDTGDVYGCMNKCLSELVGESRSCKTKNVGDACSHDGQCISGTCDTTDTFGCSNMCVSDMTRDSRARNCATKGLGEDCSHDNQCLSLSCDAGNKWGCRNQCVSELAAGTRHCKSKAVGDACSHDHQCVTESCDTKNVYGCSNRCVTKIFGCPKAHCQAGCDFCLADLQGQPLGSNLGQWQFSPLNYVEQYNETIRMTGPQITDDVLLRMTLPASCVIDKDMHKEVSVKGTMQVSRLASSRMDISSELFTGFPGEKPTISKTCNGNPEAGGRECCYSPSDVAPCSGSPYNKACEGLLSTTLSLKPLDSNVSHLSWHYVARVAEDPDDFDLGREYVVLPAVPGVTFTGRSENFSMAADFADERYKSFQFGEWGTWDINRPLSVYDRDRNCDHVNSWPQATYEFTIKLSPTVSGMTMDAAVTLTNLEILLKAPSR